LAASFFEISQVGLLTRQAAMLRLQPQGQGSIFMRSKARFLPGGARPSIGKLGISVTVLGRNSWEPLAQPVSWGRNGAGVKSGREGLRAQTNAASSPRVTATSATERPDGPG